MRTNFVVPVTMISSKVAISSRNGSNLAEKSSKKNIVKKERRIRCKYLLYPPLVSEYHSVYSISR